jgi:hypothetical protein
MKIRFATLTLALLGLCTVFTMKMPANTTDARPVMFSGGGAPTPCPTQPIAVPGAPSQTGVPCPNH